MRAFSAQAACRHWATLNPAHQKNTAAGLSPACGAIQSIAATCSYADSDATSTFTPGPIVEEIATRCR